MALKVWLPLDGNLENKGVSNAIFTGSPTYTTGKIGQCLSNGTITCTNTTIPVTISTAAQYSMCSWVKTTSTSTWIWNMGYGTVTMRGLWIGNANTGPCFAYSGSVAFTGSKVINDGNWHHVCFTVDGTISRAYVDGIDCGGSDSTITDAVASNTINIYSSETQYINDFRIYDSCLSAAAVREIAQGLVLHYKLDDITNGVKDSSGYGHTGTITGNLALNPNTAKYSSCTNLISEQKISTSGLLTNTNPIFTVNFWIKTYSNTYTAWADVMTFTGNYSFRMETNNNTGENLTWCNYPLGTSSGISNGSVNYDEWNMLTLVWNGTSIITYKNGIQVTSTTITGTEWIPNGNFSIGDNGMYMYLSDVRIYCTALSADDILQLYHTSAKVDNKQNLHTFELVENNSKIQINKRGQTLCNELEEDAATKFYKTNQIIETNEIIEF